ncbi:hypothetical protein LTR10_016430 [Elasticomyces elasticus]|uniref:Uncharacterized protein n=1 Tax=Exophiala sideris TaxID=1016849 RepID=A0ABR0JC52_9EURO|nr:hypothetical protein LTR10_016430 [Elasticomyces elasticus]KAK5031182.1 hypothetical protein LTS07_004917 [Exophiala sideris]KAK5038903.1 hypothetical protein LTR13_003934 [Exophiala sideris]KAK5060787.1 hypothetical protein LTR69_005386 [Exophiala sideris]KAK5183699.1 hypothetical protein LTR44_003981 [Eurotiomycetes sp. CCFEE 6388]
MGIPYSKEINAAFEQVTPLVGAGYEVLQTLKNIAILLACIQVLTVILLTFIFVAMMGLLITMNPDLEKERQQLVTPVVAEITGWLYAYGTPAKWLLRIFLVVSSVGFGMFLWQMSLAGVKAPQNAEPDSGETSEGGNEDAQAAKSEAKGKGKGKDKEQAK